MIKGRTSQKKRQKRNLKIDKLKRWDVLPDPFFGDQFEWVAIQSFFYFGW